MLAKVGDADFIENKISVLVKSCKCKFLEQIQIFISFFPINKTNDKFDVNEFLRDLLLNSKNVAVLLPSAAVDLGFETVIFSVSHYRVHKKDIDTIPLCKGYKLSMIYDL